MNKLFIPIMFLVCLIMTACSNDDDPYADLFSIAVELDEQGGEVQIIKHECEVTVYGGQQYVHVTLLGDQATYSYVFSPLTDNVRLVRNESSGPMFKDVVPVGEFEYIVKDLKENEELQYTLVLANVSKHGLQKLSFKIRKKLL